MLLLATETWKSHGGVQRYMRMLTRILVDRGEPFTSLTLLDDRDDQRSEAGAHTLVSCGGNKFRFCWKALTVGIRKRPSVAIVGHVGLLPVALVLQTTGFIERYAVVLHGIEAWRRLPWLWRIAAQRASAVVATTHYTTREFCYHNSLKNPSCAIIPLACSFPPSAARAHSLSPTLKLLTITRLSSADAYKGVDTLLHAIRWARELGMNLTLDLIGDGDDRARLEDVAGSLKIRDIVHFHGSVRDQELETALKESDVFVLPSKKEGFGIVYLEAMASGLPCIGANHGGTPEVIEHGESGFLIEYGDVAQLVFYLQVLIETPGLYSIMSVAARRRATEALTLQAMTESWHRLLRRLENQLLSDTRPVKAERQPAETDRGSIRVVEDRGHVAQDAAPRNL